LKTIKIITLGFQITLLTLYNLFGLVGSNNHTGIDVKLFGYLSILFGLILFSITKFLPTLIGNLDILSKLIILIAIVSGINILVFDHLNIMVEYEEWLHRGLPKKPFYFG
jgi:hypothetical protein